MARLFVADARAKLSRWSIRPEDEARLRAVTPPGWTLRIVEAPTVSDGDGGAPPSAESLDAIAEAEAYFGYGISRPLFLAAKRLKWVHSAAAGVGGLLFPEMLASEVIVTNSAGIHAIPIAEQSLAGILALTRGLDVARDLQREHRWSRETFQEPQGPMRELGGLRALILGAGGLGGALATRLTALGVICTGSRRRLDRGAPPGFARVVGPDAWRALLPATDLLVLSAPSTKETKGMIGAAELDRLPRGAIVVNMARGALVDESSLADRVRRGTLRGAVLDVYSQEPLPASSPLWELPNVIMTPHVSGVTDRFWDREMALVEGNWIAYANGRPMTNVIDRQAGY